MTARDTRPLAFVDEGLGNSSYLLDLGDGRALVVDPERDATPYLAAAERAGLSIAFTVETHLHADFLTGSRELAARRDRPRPRAGGIEWPHRGFDHGDELDLGGLRLQAVATPGHTPEHLSWLVHDDHARSRCSPGGALLVDAVARTDLIAPDQTEPLARALWRSLHERILTLPDDLPVYPTHGAGSFCSAPTNGERTTTIGRERAANPLLAAPDEDTFVASCSPATAATRRTSCACGSGTVAAPTSSARRSRHCQLCTSTTSGATSPTAPSLSTPARSSRGPPPMCPVRSRSRCARSSARGSDGSSPTTGR